MFNFFRKRNAERRRLESLVATLRSHREPRVYVDGAGELCDREKPATYSFGVDRW